MIIFLTAAICPAVFLTADEGLHIYNTENTGVVDRLEFEDFGYSSDPDDREGVGEGSLKLYGRYLYIAANKLICLDIAP